MSENVEAAKADLTATVDEVKKSVSNLAGEVKGRVGQKVSTVREETKARAEKASTFARDKYGDAREGLRSGYDKAKKDLDQLSGDVNTYVRDNPGRSVLVAAGVGFALGLLIRSAGRR